MLHQTFLFLGQLWLLFEVSQILEFLRYGLSNTLLPCNMSLLICPKTHTVAAYHKNSKYWDTQTSYRSCP